MCSIEYLAKSRICFTFKPDNGPVLFKKNHPKDDKDFLDYFSILSYMENVTGVCLKVKRKQKHKISFTKPRKCASSVESKC